MPKKLGKDYEVAYYAINENGVRTGVELSGVTDAGRYEAVLKGKGVYVGTLENAAVVTVRPRALNSSILEVKHPYARIDGENVTARYELWYRDEQLQVDEDFAVRYVVNEEKTFVTFIFEGTGNYTGTLTQKFPLIAADVILFADGEYESGVFISCILRPSFFPSQAGLLGPISAAALVTALEDHTTSRLGVGWISDIFCEGKKIGGVAIEGKLDSFSSYEYLIVSFAVRLDDVNFPPRLADMIRKVFESENSSVSMIIAKTVLTRFFAAYSDIKSPGKMMDIYKQRFILTGKKIKYIENGKKHSCRVIDVNKQTATLTVETARGELKEINSPSGVITPTKIKT